MTKDRRGRGSDGDSDVDAEAAMPWPGKGTGRNDKHAQLWPGKRAATSRLKGQPYVRPPDEAATQAVESKGSGSPIDAGLARKVGGLFSTDLSATRVHDDPGSRQATHEMGARAFAHGTDIFLGVNESAGDTELMAHELTHVAQQQGGAAEPQRKVEVGAADSPAEKQADAVAAKVAGGGQLTPQALLVDSNPTEGQALKSQFITMLKDKVTEAANAALGPAGSAIGCPYIAVVFARYEAQPASNGEAMLRRWVPALADVKTAQDMVAPILERVRAGITAWRQTGKPPADLVAAEPSLADAPPPPDAGQAHAKSLDKLESDLGPGQALEPSTVARMSRIVGSDVSEARVHTGPVAAAKAAEAGASAFAVGTNVVMGGNAPAAGSLHGDALLAHELAHVAQQKDASRDPVARKKPIGDEEHAAEQDAGMARLANFGGALDSVMKTGLQLQRCSNDKAVPAKAVDQARYHEIEAKLKGLVAQKRGLVDGSAQGDMAKIDEGIDALIKELQDDFGVRLEKDKILADADAGTDMLVVDGEIILDPSTTQHYRGERLGVSLDVDYVPPGENLQIAWRWETPAMTTPSRFLVDGIAGDKSTKQSFELGTAFWHISPQPIVDAAGLTIIAQMYIGDAKTPTKEVRTPFISMPDRPAPDIKVVNAPERIVQGSRVATQIGPYTPDQSKHSVDWFIDGKLAGEDMPNFSHVYPDTGVFKIRADLFEVDRNFGIRSKKLVKSTPEVSVEVLTQTKYGDKFLDDLDKSPFRPKQVSVNETVDSGDKALVEIQKHIDEGGSQVPYWKDRLKAQKERLEKIKDLTPDYKTAKPLPEDLTKLEAGVSYSTPITAALVMSSGGGGAQPLTMHLSVKEDGGVWNARMLDSTSKKVVKHDGSGASALIAIQAAFETWRKDNEYPTGGRVAYRYAPGGWSLGNGFETYTTWKRAKEWVDGIIQIGGFIVGAMLLADPDPTISKLIGGLMMAAVVARSSVAIYERIRNGGDILSSENILDGVAIVTSFLGLSGGVLRNAGMKAISPTTYRVGNWLIMGALAGDAGTFVYAASEAVAQLKVIQGDPTMDDSAKSGEMLRIMASLFATGAMLIVSNKELLRGGLKASDFVKTNIEPGAKPKLEVGARLDAEYELKKAGQWSPEVHKLDDGALLNKLFNQRSRIEIEASLKKTMKPEDVAALTSALGDDGMIAMAKGFGDDFPKAVAEAGTANIIAAVKKFGPTATNKLLHGLGGTGFAKLSANFEEIALKLDGDGSTGSYRWGGTGKTQAALSGGQAKVTKSADPATGSRKLDVETPAGKVTLEERGRYAEVKIDPAALSPEDAGALNKLYSDYGITDDAAKKSVLEALENARLGNAKDLNAAIKQVRPVLDEAKASAKKASDGGTPTTTEDVVKAGGKTPLAPEAQGDAMTQAKALVAGGILENPDFQSARTPAEGRDAITQKLQSQFGKDRAETKFGKSGGKSMTKVQFKGDLFVDAKSSTRYESKGKPVTDTDVVPDLDVAYVTDAGGGKLNVEYVAGVKIGKSAAAAKDAANQNSLGKAAVEAGSNRFETTTRSGDKVWAETKSVSGYDDNGAKVDLTGKLTWSPTGTTETIGAKGTKGFDANLPISSKELDDVVIAIWRLAEMKKR